MNAPKSLFAAISLLLSVTSSHGATGPNQTPCTNLFAYEPWYAFVRDPHEPVKDRAVVDALAERVSRSVHDALEPALHQGRYTGEAYIQMIQAQHRILAEGYNGHLVAKSGPAARPEGASGRIVTTEYLREKKYLQPNTAGFIRLGFLEYPAAKMTPKDFRADFDGWTKQRYPVELAHLSTDMLPYNTWENTHTLVLTHYYPNPDHLPAYLWQASELMKNLVHPPDARYRLLYLAEYYRLTINAHFFITVNNSLFMSHVNYFLAQWGLRPIPHGRLDFLAVKERRFENFLKEFIAAVSEYNVLDSSILPP